MAKRLHDVCTCRSAPFASLARQNSNARPVVSIKRTFCLNNSSGHGLFPQFRFQNFPRRIFRQRGPDDDLFRHFVVSQLAADEFVQRLFVERLTFRRCDERHGLLAAPRVRHADDLCLAPVLSGGLFGCFTKKQFGRPATKYPFFANRPSSGTIQTNFTVAESRKSKVEGGVGKLDLAFVPRLWTLDHVLR